MAGAVHLDGLYSSDILWSVSCFSDEKVFVTPDGKILDEGGHPNFKYALEVYMMLDDYNMWNGYLLFSSKEYYDMCVHANYNEVLGCFNENDILDIYNGDLLKDIDIFDVKDKICSFRDNNDNSFVFDFYEQAMIMKEKIVKIKQDKEAQGCFNNVDVVNHCSKKDQELYLKQIGLLSKINKYKMNLDLFYEKNPRPLVYDLDIVIGLSLDADLSNINSDYSSNIFEAIECAKKVIKDDFSGIHIRNNTIDNTSIYISNVGIGVGNHGNKEMMLDR